MVLGTLVYTVVLGFFNDYTDILQTRSYSVTFMVAIVLQILTYLTFKLKDKVAGHFKTRTDAFKKPGLVLSVWFIMFVSKFVFLAVISVVFRSSVYVSGFIGLMAIIITMTVAKQLIDLVYKKLGD